MKAERIGLDGLSQTYVSSVVEKGIEELSAKKAGIYVVNVVVHIFTVE